MGIKKEKEFVDKLNENIVGKEIYIWGAGQHANNLLDVLQKYKFKLDKIKGIIDSDIKKDGKSMYNITVYYKENFFNNLIKNCSDIVISSTFENEIYEELIQKTSDINIIKMHDGAIGELVDGPEYGTKGWLEQQFDNINSLGDRWGHRWRASQKLRHKLCLKMIDEYLKYDNKTILDIGCALGDFTNKIYLRNINNNVYATDLSENAIKVVKNIYKNIHFKVDTLPNISFSEKKFDIITCLEVLYYLDEKEQKKALENMQFILNDSGKILLSSVVNRSERYFQEEKLKEIVEQYFDIIDIKYCYNFLYNIYEANLLKYINEAKNNKSFKYKIKYFLLAETWIAYVLNSISKTFIGSRAKTHIFILCQRKKEN
ncbi:GntR family transcriptional regulator [Clostridium botulinum]|uniref:class I SAM-dependent methyltransferase n=1 Tax=Clostridium botulinum TaxID=1491 RepID=UPI001969C4B0|nr:class I SAM-dependent methyltransferase [Clostridium botulinum]MBN3345371.1 GntR family transcriptional regulator [Clostridium botulinum]